MDNTWLRRLSLALVLVGVVIAVLGFGFVRVIDGLLGVGILVAGAVIYVLVPNTNDSLGTSQVSDRTRQILIMLISLAGIMIGLAYIIFT